MHLGIQKPRHILLRGSLYPQGARHTKTRRVGKVLCYIALRLPQLASFYCRGKMMPSLNPRLVCAIRVQLCLKQLSLVLWWRVCAEVAIVSMSMRNQAVRHEQGHVSRVEYNAFAAYGLRWCGRVID